MIPKDGLLEVIRVARTEDSGFTVDAPLGSYYVKELTTAGPEYILDDTKYPVVFEYRDRRSRLYRSRSMMGSLW